MYEASRILEVSKLIEGDHKGPPIGINLTHPPAPGGHKGPPFPTSSALAPTEFDGLFVRLMRVGDSCGRPGSLYKGGRQGQACNVPSISCDKTNEASNNLRRMICNAQKMEFLATRQWPGSTNYTPRLFSLTCGGRPPRVKMRKIFWLKYSSSRSNLALSTGWAKRSR